ncbi:MAG: hypothetical protein PVJ68_12130, partial [Candidatus Thiodiazotropha sp.]
MFIKNYLLAGKSLLSTLSIVVLVIFAQAGNCTESSVNGLVYNLINAGSGQAVDVDGMNRTD